MHPLWRSGAIIFSVLAAGTLAFIWFEFRTSPDDDVLGSGRQNCQLHDDPAISNGGGRFAILRVANCPAEFAQGVVYYVVFVLDAGQAADASNIALQYEWGESVGLRGPSAPPPHIAWSGPSSLKVVCPGFSDRVIVQRSQIGRVKIAYSLRTRNLFDFLDLTPRQ
jgi:hypothetical protein